MSFRLQCERQEESLSNRPRHNPLAGYLLEAAGTGNMVHAHTLSMTSAKLRELDVFML